jgi:plastocyanin
MHRHRRRWTALLLLLLAGCTSGLKRPAVTAELEPDAAGMQRVVVNMHSFYFEPNRIVVRAGHPVELVLKNRARLIPHNFTIADSELAMSAGAWLGTGHLSFTPRTPGTYEFFCHVDHHAKKGMTGTLVVLP